MGWNLTPLGTIQKIPQKQLVGTVTTVGSTITVIYTVPAGKKATITMMSDQNVSLGANTNQNAKVSGQNLRKMVALETNQVSENINNFTMLAGDTIGFVGDNVADNGTINYFISVQELPA